MSNWPTPELLEAIKELEPFDGPTTWARRVDDTSPWTEEQLKAYGLEEAPTNE